MYCKKCNTILKSNEITCPNCNFDNTNNYNNSNDLENIANSTYNNQKTKSIMPIILLLFLLSFGITCLYLIKDTKAHTPIMIPTTTTEALLQTNEFIFENIILKYPDTFGSSKNTIFYKNNTAINISIKNIDATEYNNILNGNDCLDSKIGTINAKTYAGDNFYSYIFIYQNLYYDITINYINDTTIYTEDLGKTISKIINSIEIK